MALDKLQTQAAYRRRARHYDAAARLFDLAGFAEARWRREAVEALRLRPGARVVEIGCGTGLNLPHLVRAVGPAGQVFGVDLTDAMLLRACERVRRAGWTNVRLIQADAARYEFPPSLDGVLATFALTLVPEFDDVVHRGARALAPGGRFVILDVKRPAGAPAWLVRLVALANRPFGASLDLADRHPWESAARYLSASSMTELYHGFAYLCTGEAWRADPATSPAVPSPDRSDEEEAMNVTDPVCGMQIDPQKAVGKVEYGGKTYWFCSEVCRRRFELEPAKYAPPASA